MKLARYIGGGEIAIVDEPAPICPSGGLLVRTLASGLCSGELMDWYMEKKVPHVLGHEVCGVILESEDARFPVGNRVFAHHHSPCLACDFCKKGLYVHCAQWKRTKLDPGGMAEMFAVSPENLNDSFLVDDLRPIDAALVEPLGCVVKSIERSGIPLIPRHAPWREVQPGGESRTPPGVAGHRVSGVAGHDVSVAGERGIPELPLPSGGEAGESEFHEDEPGEGVSAAVIGLGSLGLMHLLLLPGAAGYDLNPERIRHARSLGLDARPLDGREKADTIFVCPGSKPALDLAIDLANPGGTIVLFAPLPPTGEIPVDLNRLYFNDIRLVTTYSCGPEDTGIAASILRSGQVKAEMVVSDFIGISELPEAYQQMKRGEILKPMVVF
ncbi:MAG TPA: alcohol dehydrogenase catalytic domain-containing protein [Fimbriimonadaceae bacterium]|nr:alcohol dehydrogenase catalytic domain-containing protein [Fimbriimonadaceae bacterium]